MGCARVLEANSRAYERGLSLVHANKPHINLRIAPAWICTNIMVINKIMKPTLCIELPVIRRLSISLFGTISSAKYLSQALKTLFDLLTSRINDISVFIKRLWLFKKGHAVFLIKIALSLALWL